jgi:hypothetical protein
MVEVTTKFVAEVTAETAVTAAPSVATAPDACTPAATSNGRRAYPECHNGR